MDLSCYQVNVQKLVTQRNIFLFLSVVLSIGVVLLTTLLFFKTERTVIIPTTGPSFWIEDKKVSHAYLEKVGMFLSDCLLNRSPSDVDKKNKTILEYVHPAFYHEIRKVLLQEKEDVMQKNQSFFFRAENSYVDMAQEAFIVEGEFLIFVGKSGTAPVCVQREKRKFTLKFLCSSGKLQLISLKKEDIK